jgi:hypothetical protein
LREARLATLARPESASRPPSASQYPTPHKTPSPSLLPLPHAYHFVRFHYSRDLLPLHAHRALLSPAFPDSQPPTTPTSFGLASTSTSSALFYYPSHEPPPYKGTWPSPADKTLLITATLSAVPWSVVEAAAAREGCTRIEIWGEEPIPDGWPAGQAFTRGESCNLKSLHLGSC